MERKSHTALIVLFFLLSILTGCSANPFGSTNHEGGTAAGTLAGGAIGAGGAALLAAPKSIIALAGIGGAAIGYYATSLRYASGSIIQAGGQVYTLGDYVGIELPSDALFDSNSADLLPEATPILKGVVTVLKRYPDHNLMISGNTSGFGRTRYEQKLSEDRAKAVASFLWANGILNRAAFVNNDFKPGRRLTYVGYGNYMPIANNITEEGIRANSRIQITAYPRTVKLKLTKKQKAFGNIGGGSNGPSRKQVPSEPNYENEFPGSVIPESAPSKYNTGTIKNYSTVSPRSPQPDTYIPERANLKGDAWQNQNTIIPTQPTTPVPSTISPPAIYNYKAELAK